MNVAFQMDDLSKLNFTTDSTIELILESQQRDNINSIVLSVVKFNLDKLSI